jgi:hypothetical protein
MKMRGRFVALLTAGLAAPLLIGGCKDQAAQQRAEIQKTIARVGRQLEQTPTPLAPDDERFEETRRALNGIVASLSAVGEGEAGQQAAGALLAAAAHRKLASMSLVQAEQIESEHRRLRFLLHSEIDAATRLDALAASRERLSTDDQQAMLGEERVAARQQLHEFTQRMAGLDGPIAERETANEEDMQKAAGLDERANALRREATERGHADGLPSFEEAVRLEREADGYKYRVAHRENDLRHDLHPERDLAASQVESLQSMLSEIEAAEQSLTERDTLTAAQAESIRRSVADFGQTIRQSLTTLGQGASADLEERYAEALSHLEKAATQANRAVSKSPRGESDAARLLLAQVYGEQGRLHWARARGLADQITVLQRLVDAQATLGRFEQSQAELTAANTKHQQALQQAEDAFTSAREQLQQVRGQGAADLAALKRTMDLSLAALSGQPVDLGDEGADAAGAPMPGRAASPAATDGYASPEELLAFIEQVKGDDFDILRQFLDAIHATTETTRAMVRLQLQGIEPTRQLIEAIKEQFGEQAYEQYKADMAMGMAQTAYQNLSIADRTDTRVTVNYSNALVPAGTFDLILVDGSWLIDGETLFAFADPAVLQQALATGPVVYEVMRDLADRIGAGEFASAEQAMQTLMAEVMNAANPGG